MSRHSKLRETLDLTEELGKAGELPEAELSESGISPGRSLSSTVTIPCNWKTSFSPSIFVVRKAGCAFLEG
jgi:hypothetical protein